MKPNFERFLPSVLTFCTIYTFVYRYFCVFSHWKKYHAELTFFKKIFHNNGYIEDFYIFYFLSTSLKKTYKQQKKKKKKKRLALALPYLGVISLITGNKLQKAFKDV